jgi:hypothetical protein
MALPEPLRHDLVELGPLDEISVDPVLHPLAQRAHHRLG